MASQHQEKYLALTNSHSDSRLMSSSATWFTFCVKDVIELNTPWLSREGNAHRPIEN
jgi:hypothetical protein